MFVHDMTEAECRRALKQANAGRLACARNNQPYVVPMYFAYSENYLYAISTVGQKIEWMRANPLVCIEVDNITSPDEWMSLVVFGRYEELLDLPRFQRARELALDLLQRRSAWWWEPACICENHRKSSHSCTPVAYRIHIDRISGHHATADKAGGRQAELNEMKPPKRSLLSNLLAFVRHLQSQKRSLQ